MKIRHFVATQDLSSQAFKKKMFPLVVSEVVLKQRWNWEKVSILIDFRQVMFDAYTVGSPAVLY